MTEELAALDRARDRTLQLVAPIADAELERVHSPLMSPLVWDLGHIAAFEDLWLVHRFGGEPMVRRDLDELVSAGRAAGLYSTCLLYTSPSPRDRS